MTQPTLRRATVGLATLRAECPVFRHRIWLQTPGHAPGLRSVTVAVREAIDQWEDGRANWRAWEAMAEEARERFARRIGAAPAQVALTGSLAEAAATVARSLAAAGQSGALVVGAEEFQSNLLPWQEVGGSDRPLRLVTRHPEQGWTAALLDAIRPGTALVAVSEVQSASGERVAIEAVAERCAAVGARLFVNLTQSAGVLPFDAVRLGVDYVAAHGYKFLLSPRGCGWLYVRPDRLDELSPLIPNWKSPGPTGTMYGVAPRFAPDTRRLDASLAWFSWVGANAALTLLDRHPQADIAAQATDLAELTRGGLRRLGFTPTGLADAGDPPSHIVCWRVANPEQLAAHLRERLVDVTVRLGVLRAGFHGFNTESDVDALLGGLAEWQASTSPTSRSRPP